MKLQILSSNSTIELMKEAEKYNISQVGSLTVSNSHYFLTFLGEPKVTEETPVQPKVTKGPKKVIPSA